MFVLLPLLNISDFFPVFLWLNSNIKNDNKSIFISGFASKNINFVGQFFHANGKTNNNGIILSQNTILKAEISFDSINRCFT